MSLEYYPPPAFYFGVEVIGATPATAGQPPKIDASFQEVSGIRADLGFEEVTEGGENRFVYRLPKATKYPNLVLKRGFVIKDSSLAEWVIETVSTKLTLPIKPKTIKVTLYATDGQPAAAWSFTNSYPLRWELGQLNSTDNRVLIETFELSYAYFERLL